MDKDFITDNLGLVHSCCKRFVGRGIEYDDLFQAGCIGIVKAAKGFDESRGLKFSTYAVPVILGEIRHLFREGGSIKVSRGLKELSSKIMALREREIKRTGREPGIGEIAELLGVSPAEAAEALAAAMPVYSLTVSDEEGTAQIDVPVESCEEKVSDMISLGEAVELLPDGEKDIIRLRYFSNKTQTQTAEILGISQVQVSRKEKVILSKLKTLLTA